MYFMQFLNTVIFPVIWPLTTIVKHNNLEFEFEYPVDTVKTHSDCIYCTGYMEGWANFRKGQVDIGHVQGESK